MKYKRMTALLLTVVLFTCLIPANAFAAQLRICDAEDYPETYTFNGNVPNLPAAFANHTSSNFNLYYLRGSYDTAVYCIQISSPRISADDDYGTYSDPQVANLSSEQKYLLSAALCMGHTGGWNNRPFQVATQIVVWLITTGAYVNEAQRNAVLGGYIGNADVRAYANQLWADCWNYYTVPSFSVNVDQNAPEYDVEYDAESGTYYIELIDENNVLDRYDILPEDMIDGISYEKNGNVLTLRSSNPIPKDAIIRLTNTTAKYQNRAILMYMYYSGNQEMAYRRYNQVDPVHGYLKLNEVYSSATIIKQSEDDLVAGLKFRITKPDDVSFEPIILVTDDTGRTQEEVIGIGTYLVEEIDTPAKYIQPEPQTFTINVIGEKVVLTFENKCRDLYMIKTSEDNKVEGLEFRVTCEELGYETTIKTDSEGCWHISGLEPGSYLVEEINTPDQYTQMEPITVEVTFDQEVYNITAENTFKRGDVEINKKDKMFGKNLANCKFGIYTIEGELVQEVTTNANGVVVSDILTYGEYYLKELSPAPGYKINETEYEFFIDTDGMHEIIVVEDDPRIGTVTISYEDHGGQVDTGSTRGLTLPLYIGAIWLCLVMLGAAVKKELSLRQESALGK